MIQHLMAYFPLYLIIAFVFISFGFGIVAGTPPMRNHRKEDRIVLLGLIVMSIGAASGVIAIVGLVCRIL